jgi:hypothetical protein
LHEVSLGLLDYLSLFHLSWQEWEKMTGDVTFCLYFFSPNQPKRAKPGSITRIDKRRPINYSADVNGLSTSVTLLVLGRDLCPDTVAARLHAHR